MGELKISIITVCYNSKATIADCIRSVAHQTYNFKEHIIIDGASDDGTLDIINQHKDKIDRIISEADKGIYDAINKGIGLATGDIIGILHADDRFASSDILSAIVNSFDNNSCDILYGDLDYVDLQGNTIREWRSGAYSDGMFNKGWMPPHPTFYCRRKLFESFGNYRLDYGTAADYELMLRYIHVNRSPVCYLPKVLVKMTVGGVSNRSIKNRLKAMYYDIRAMYHNRIYFPPVTIILKPLRKIKQFW